MLNTIKTAPKQRKKSSAIRKQRKFIDFSCALPALIFFAVFTYYPIISLFNISLTDWNLMRDTYEYVGFKNYAWLFNGGLDRFLSSLKVTAIYTLGEVVLSLVFGLLLALMFSRMSRSFGVMRTVVVLPRYASVSASAMVFLWMYNENYGIINQVLKKAASLWGGNVANINWLGTTGFAMLSILIFSLWRSVGYTMMIYLSAIKGISQDYYEAAELDGAGGFQRLINITIPLVAPTTLFLGVTTFISSMKVFQTIDLLTAGGPYESTTVLVYFIQRLAFTNHRLDRAATVGVVFFFVLLISTILTMRWSERKVNYDS